MKKHGAEQEREIQIVNSNYLSEEILFMALLISRVIVDGRERNVPCSSVHRVHRAAHPRADGEQGARVSLVMLRNAPVNIHFLARRISERELSASLICLLNGRAIETAIAAFSSHCLFIIRIAFLLKHRACALDC